MARYLRLSNIVTSMSPNMRLAEVQFYSVTLGAGYTPTAVSAVGGTITSGVLADLIDSSFGSNVVWSAIPTSITFTVNDYDASNWTKFRQALAGKFDNGYEIATAKVEYSTNEADWSTLYEGSFQAGGTADYGSWTDFVTVGSGAGTSAGTSSSASTSETLTAPLPLFCAVSTTSNSIATSPDGATWSTASLPSATWRAVASNGTTIVAISGSGYKAATSSDGVTWTQQTMPSTATWFSIAYGNGVFVAVANSSNKVAVSSDGVSWAQYTLPASSGWRDIAWNGSVFCVIDSWSATALTSPDGITWSSHSLPAAVDWSNIAWNGSVFCAIARFASSATSPDGATWTGHAMPSSHNWSGIAWNGSVFCVVASDPTDVALTSPDGITWTPQTMPVSAYWYHIAWNGTVFCAITSQSSTIAATSPDGVTWTQQTLPLSADWTQIHGAAIGILRTGVANSSGTGGVSSESKRVLGGDFTSGMFGSSAFTSEGSEFNTACAGTVSSTTPISAPITWPVTSSSSLTATFTATPLKLLDAAASSHVASTTTLTVAQLLYATMTSGVIVVGLRDIAENAAWVMNYVTDAHWRYDQFEFNSFARIGNRYFAAASDGIYELAGDTDAGDAIHASVLFGKTDFDSGLQKRVLRAYVGVRSNGELRLRVLVPGADRVYAVLPKSEMAGATVDLGRGVQSRYWQFELQNDSGADFELDMLELYPVVLTRYER